MQEEQEEQEGEKDASSKQPVTLLADDKHAPFGMGEDVPFSFLCSALQQVSEQKGANSKEAMKDIMAKAFYQILQLKPSQLIQAYLFCIVKIGSDYEQAELGIGPGILVKSVSNTTGRSVIDVGWAFGCAP